MEESLQSSVTEMNYGKQFRRGALAGTLLGAFAGYLMGNDIIEWSQIGLPLGALVRTMPSMLSDSH